VRLDAPPRSYRNVAGRKFAWQGDYWRTLTPIGIWKPVRLEASGPLRLRDVYPKSEIHADGSATVNVQVSLANHSPKRKGKACVRAVIHGKNFDAGPFAAEVSVPVDGSEATATVSVPVPDARLWWPWELGRPNRYVVETSVLDDTGALSDREKTAFGIRHIRMPRNPGYTEQEVRNPWTMVLNGKRLFLRSANWGGPPDIFYGRNSSKKYRTLVQMARQANLNNLRIFGWHPTEVDEFHELCDELGITVRATSSTNRATMRGRLRGDWGH
jgi:beta-mannosidase